MNDLKNVNELSLDIFWSLNLLKWDLLLDEITFGLWKELLFGPLHPTACKLPGLRGAMVQKFGKHGDDECGGADDVDHRWHGEAAGCLDLPDGVCVFRDGLHQDGEHYHARDKVDEVEKVGEGLLGPGYLDPGCDNSFS